jgi:WD40 repeat protein
VNNQIGEEIQVESLLFVPRVQLLAGVGFWPLSERVVTNGLSLHKIGGAIFLWSAEDGRLWEAIPFSKDVRPKHIDVSPDGKRIAVVFAEHGSGRKPFNRYGLGCYSTVEKKWLWKWNWAKDEMVGEPLSVRFTPGGRSLLVVGYFSVWYYASETGEKVSEFKGLLKKYALWKYAARTCYVSPSCRLLVIWQEKPWEGRVSRRINKYVTLWDLAAGEEVARWEKPKYECGIATFSSDEESVIFGCKDGYVREWSIKARTVTRELKLRAGVDSLVFSPDGRFLAVNCGIRDVFVLEWGRQKRTHEFDQAGKNYSLIEGKQYPMVFSSDGNYFALLEKGRICLYSTSTWEQKWCVDPKPPDVLND